ncbi:MAG TPA: hypothetical protein VK779_01950 [Rhizomicrobium sp.]|nr:hypothetical protein [Rhizomicrobium sp.]
MSDLPLPGTGDTEDIKSTATYRGAKAAVILLGALIVIAFGVLVVGLSMKLSGHKPAPPRSADLALPPGAVIEATAVQNDRLIMRLRVAGGEEVDIVDTTDGHLVGRITTTPVR